MIMNGLDAIKEIRFDNLANQIFDSELKIIEKELKLLQQYKDIEEELGIDLITLVKTLKEGAYFKGFFGGERFRPTLRTIVNTSNGCSFIFGEMEYEKEYRFKDYGKTWALTKEELLWNQY